MREEEELFRYENKYLITAAQAELLECRVDGICLQDDFAGNGGEYKIRSLYFDDYDESSYWDNERGADPRSKYRLRIYDGRDDVIFLEQKIKKHGKIRKDRAQVSREFCCRLLEDAWDRIQYPGDNKVVNRLLTAYHTRRLRPKIIVEYHRRPYICPEGDIRVTFDRDICFSGETEGFFDEDLFLHPVMDVGKELLEIKFREFMPDFLYQEVGIKQLQQCTFSKYYLCETIRKSEGKAYVI